MTIGQVHTAVSNKLMSISGCDAIEDGSLGAVCCADPTQPSKNNCKPGSTCNKDTATCTAIPNYCDTPSDCKFGGLTCDTPNKRCICSKVGFLCGENSVCTPTTTCGGIPTKFNVNPTKYPNACVLMKGDCTDASIQSSFGGKNAIEASMSGKESGLYILSTTDGASAQALADPSDIPGDTWGAAKALCYYDYTKPAKNAR